MPRKTSMKTVASSRSGNSAGARLVRHRRPARPSDQHDDLDDDEDLHVEPEAAEDVGEVSLKTLPVEERLLHVGPARAGEDQGGQAAEDDDGRDRGDHRPAARAAAPGRLAGDPALRRRLGQRASAAWPLRRYSSSAAAPRRRSTGR